MNNIYLFDQFGAGSLYSGPGNYFANLIKANSNTGYNFHLVHGNKDQKDLPIFKSTHFISQADNRINNIIYSMKVKSFVKNHDIDIIQTTHAYMGSISAATTGIKKGIPTFLRVAKSHSELSNRNTLAKLLNLNKKKINILNLSNGIVAISKEIEKELLNLGVAEKKIHYIPNGVDIHRFNRSNTPKDFQFPFNDEFVVIGFCGALIERKQPHILLEAVRLLPKNYAVCFIGPYDNSSYVNNMMSYIKEYNLTNQVYFTGYINNPEDYLIFCDYFCLPSLNEGMPNALLEAMASKCIPISTDISGVRDIIDSEDTGFIIEPNADSIADVIKNTINNREIYSAAAHNRIVNHFSATSAFTKYISMYKGNL